MVVEVITGTSGNPDTLRRLTRQWADVAQSTSRWRGTTAGVASDGAFIALTELASEPTPIPGHDQWRTEILAMLDGDPSSQVYDRLTLRELPDRSATAGFVQFVLGKVTNLAGADQYLKDFDSAYAPLRPDCVGRLMASRDDGRFVGMFYFTSEEQARAGETQELDPELADLIQQGQTLSDGPARFIDLTSPWIHRPPMPAT